MGDRGKKDKDKARKQKVKKQEQTARNNIEKTPQEPLSRHETTPALKPMYGWRFRTDSLKMGRPLTETFTNDLGGFRFQRSGVRTGGIP
jgi:hypothetical protein